MALEALPDGIRLRVKVVPNASRDRIAGMLGDCLKVAVTAPPEAGKANRAVCQLLAGVLAVPQGSIMVVEGATKPRKRLEVLGISLCDATSRLSQSLA